MQYFSNSQGVIDSCIITESGLLRGVIIDDRLHISEMLPVQISSLMESQEEDMLEYRRIIKTNVMDATIEEIGFGVNLCNIPSNDKLEASYFSNLLQWYAIQ